MIKWNKAPTPVKQAFGPKWPALRPTGALGLPRYFDQHGGHVRLGIRDSGPLAAICGSSGYDAAIVSSVSQFPEALASFSRCPVRWCVVQGKDRCSSLFNSTLCIVFSSVLLRSRWSYLVASVARFMDRA